MKSKDVGEKIAELRKKQNRTQKQLAEELGVTNKAVSKWETGEGYPDIVLLPDISYVLKISIDELLDNNPFKENAKLEYMESLQKRQESNNKIRALKNAICCGFIVLFISILISFFYALISFVKIKSDYWTIAFAEALTDTMPLAILICLIVITLVYFMDRKKHKKGE